MIKVVYNECYGGFSLSRKAAERLYELGVKRMEEQLLDIILEKYNSYYLSNEDCSRHDPRLVQVVEELGEEANGVHANLEIAELNGNKYVIEDYDGFESVKEPDDIDWIVVRGK
jgi:hypothetical protein